MRKTIYKTLILLPIPIFFITLSIGGYTIPFTKIIDILLFKFNNTSLFGSVLNLKEINVLWDIRLPRILLAMLVGASLSVSGASFQAILRNPLVDPYILGLSSGAAFGAALSMAYLNIPVQISAFIFAIIGVFICYLVSVNKNEVSVVALILSGVIVSSIFTALLSIIQITVDPLKLQGMIYWSMGGFHTANWNKVYDSLPYLSICLLIIYTIRWKLNILSLGEKEAKILGLNPERYKILIIILSTFLASTSVAVSGIISLVGLMIPHLLRMIIGPDNTKLIPLCITFGASYLVIVDAFSRNMFTFEIPIGIFTTLLGAPFFIYLLRKTKVGGMN